MQIKHILLIQLIISFCFFCLFPAALSTAGQTGNTVTSKIDLSHITHAVTAGKNFIYTMDGHGGDQLFSFGQPEKTLKNIHAATYTADTRAIYAALDEFSVSAMSSPLGRRIVKLNGDFQQGTVGQQLNGAFEIELLDQNDDPVADAAIIFAIAKGGGTFSDNTTEITVLTDANGRAAAEVILGTYTWDNPVGWLESGLNTQQVGLNVIECYPAENASYKTIFTAYGFPDTPSKIHLDESICNLQDRVCYVLNYHATGYVLVLDQYDNPVSNVLIDVTPGAITLRSGGCSGNVVHGKGALVMPAEEIFNQPPPYAYERFAAEYSGTLSLTSDYIPVVFAVFTGGTANADYTIDLTTAGSITEQLIVSSDTKTAMFGNCDGENYTPDSTYPLVTIYHGPDERKPGDTIGMYFWIRELRELGETTPCGSCSEIVGIADYYTEGELREMDFEFYNNGALEELVAIPITAMTTVTAITGRLLFQIPRKYMVYGTATFTKRISGKSSPVNPVHVLGKMILYGRRNMYKGSICSPMSSALNSRAILR